MRRLGPALSWGTAWLLVALTACSSQPVASARDVADANDTGSTLSAKSEGERALLRELPTLPNGKARQVAGAGVVAEAPYAAASGRTCRALHVTETSQHGPKDRLACSDGKIWFFVPNVFGVDTAAE